MIKTEAFILDEVTVVLSITDVEDVLADMYNDWVKYGCRNTLHLPTVQKGVFEGYLNERNAPIGRFTSDRGAVLAVYEDFIEKLTESISA